MFLLLQCIVNTKALIKKIEVCQNTYHAIYKKLSHYIATPCCIAGQRHVGQSKISDIIVIMNRILNRYVIEKGGKNKGDYRTVFYYINRF